MPVPVESHAASNKVHFNTGPWHAPWALSAAADTPVNRARNQSRVSVSQAQAGSPRAQPISAYLKIRWLRLPMISPCEPNQPFCAGRSVERAPAVAIRRSASRSQSHWFLLGRVAPLKALQATAFFRPFQRCATGAAAGPWLTWAVSSAPVRKISPKGPRRRAETRQRINRDRLRLFTVPPDIV